MTLTKKVDVADDALDILDSNLEWSEHNGKTAARITVQLDRKEYLKVNKALEALGGKWNRKAKAHLFPHDPRPELEAALDGGYVEVEKDGFFRTPEAVVMRMLDIAGPLQEPILEPSAGDGAILDVLAREGYSHLLAIEKNARRRGQLSDKGYSVMDTTDFLDCRASRFPSIIMNPPFEQMQDVDHITHAFESCLKPGGQLVSVVSESPFFRQEGKAERFRQLVSRYGHSKRLPDGSFKESGTMVRTRLVYLRRPTQKELL